MPRRSSRRKNSRQAKNKAKRERRRNRKKKQALNDDDLKEVVVWKERIETNIQDAIKCYKRMDENDLLDDKDLLAALSRYVENTGEAITKLDEITHEVLFAMLTEVPVDNDEDEALTWKNLKGIRVRLAHKFWDTNNRILRNTVRDDFPILATLFSRLLIDRSILRDDTSVQLTLEKPDLAYTVGFGDRPSLGEYSLIATFSVAGWQLDRLSLVEEPPGYISGMFISTVSQTKDDRTRRRSMRFVGKTSDVLHSFDIVDSL